MRITRVSSRTAATVLLAALPALAAVTLAGPAAAQPRPHTTAGPPALVTLRIEGANRTIFEGTVATHGHDVTTSAGGTHHCDGTNGGASATAGGTATTALDDGARQAGFGYDGSYEAAFDDYFITRIGPDTQTATQFWGLLDNWRFTSNGGCRTRPDSGDNLLWAYDAFNKAHALRLTGPQQVNTDQPYTVTVTDGATAAPVEGATVTGRTTDTTITRTTDAAGDATFTATGVGVTRLKADRSDSIRSNTWDVVAGIRPRG